MYNSIIYTYVWLKIQSRVRNLQILVHSFDCDKGHFCAKLEEQQVLVIGKNFDNFPRLVLFGGVFDLLLVSLHVFQKMIRAYERSAAGGAHKLLLSSMSSLVPRQLVTSGKDFVTVRIRTVERFLTYKIALLMNLVGVYVVSYYLPVWTL